MILAKHEEEQLIQEATVFVKRITNASKHYITNSMECICRIVHDQVKLVIPTCLVVLPYLLHMMGNRLVIKDTDDLGPAISLAQHLLDLHLCLTLLSFWLIVKKRVG